MRASTTTSWARRRALRAALPLAALFAAALSPGASASPFTQPEWLVYSKSSPTTQFDIYASRDDTTDEVQLTRLPDYEDVPSVSPDGQEMLIQQEVNGRYRLITVNRDGTGLRVVSRSTDRPNIGGSAWSPDSRSIVFGNNYNGAGHQNLVVASDIGGHRLEIADDATGDAAWGPNGQIAYETGSELVVVDRNGVEQWRNPTRGHPYGWTPDGRGIVVINGGRTLGSKIWIVPSDGTSLPRGAKPWFDAELQIGPRSELSTPPDIAPLTGRAVFVVYNAVLDTPQLAILSQNGALTLKTPAMFSGWNPAWGHIQ